MRKVYHVYWNGAGNLTDRLRAAVRDYYARHRRLPEGVVVYPTLVGEAAKALAALELSRIPVSGTGGCLVTEVWLQAGQEEA